MVYIQRVKDVPMLDAWRCGCIVVTPDGKYGIFVDRETGDLTDAGGMCLPGEHPIECVLRELYEETLGVFGILYRDEVANQLVIHDNHYLILVLKLAVDPTWINLRFQSEYSKVMNEKIHAEVSNILWLTADELINRRNDIYHKVRHLFLIERIHSLLFSH